VPPSLGAIVLRAIAKDPGDRFQTAPEMAAALRAQENEGSPRRLSVTASTAFWISSRTKTPELE
jgi:hypothetical protein